MQPREDDDDVMRVIHGVSLETSVPISNKGLLLFIDDIRSNNRASNYKFTFRK